MKTPALYSKGRGFEPHRRRFFTPTVVLLSFNKPETVLWTIAKILYNIIIIRNSYLISLLGDTWDSNNRRAHQHQDAVEDGLSEVSASAANVANDGKHPLLEFAMRYFREGREKFDLPEENNQNGGKSNFLRPFQKYLIANSSK